MKYDPKTAKRDPRPKAVRKTIVINGFTGEEREVDPRRIKVIDGMEIGETRVDLDNGTKLAIVADGKYTTMGKPNERWGEVIQVRVRPDGDYEDGELMGWTPLFSTQPKPAKKPAAVKTEKKTPPQTAPSKKDQPNRAPKSAAKPAAKSGKKDPKSAKPAAPGKLAPRPKKTR